ncbi:hypothetical protein GCM10010413_31760 [Promicromonospora sukumoe]|uniref:Uncharacterized protein n=1 Tax=Promicromonospora sukumoe TaxID=88382 RepID=A0A7W3PDW7_9MICO|nr:hypothetical protein [Promicromonospora sukumoe]MBA8807929.1 hypothetical protein [Promicromonospora sukumoe]
MTAAETTAGGGGLELLLRPAAASVPLDRIAFADVEVVATGGAASVSARLNLVEGDLEIEVAGPGSPPVRATWPWPADSAPRSVDLPAGGRLVASVPLLSSGSAPLFRAPGRYELTARFAARRGESIASRPVSLVRTAPDDAALATRLGDRDVLQSILGAGVLGAAAPSLELLAASSDAGTAAAANLALGRSDALNDVLSGARTDAVADPAALRAVAALLPPGATGQDDRRDAVVALSVARAPAPGTAAEAVERAVAALTGRPLLG